MRTADKAFHDDHIKIHVPHSNTDIHRGGQDVFISRSNSSTCPETLLVRYLHSASITLSNIKDYLFRNLIYLKPTKQYISGKRAVSCTRLRELFMDFFRQLGLDETAYSLHSVRAGRATEIVKNFPDVKSKEHLLKIHADGSQTLQKICTYMKT